jgi:hypothetical protein
MNATPRILIACAVSALLGAPAAWAAATGDAQARYQQERAACLNGQSHEDRATCLREAGAALNDARRGLLDDRGADYQRNALMRCQALPAADREACHARMRGEGTTEGSVEQGAILREYREIVPADQLR